jgi:hypothetical protein
MAFIFVESDFGKLLDIGSFTASHASKGVPLAGVLGIIAPVYRIFRRPCRAAGVSNSLRCNVDDDVDNACQLKFKTDSTGFGD